MSLISGMIFGELSCGLAHSVVGGGTLQAGGRLSLRVCWCPILIRAYQWAVLI